MNFAKIDLNSEEQKQRLIDFFINSIYVYNDKIIVAFNYKDDEKCIDFDELSKVTKKKKKKRTPTNASVRL